MAPHYDEFPLTRKRYHSGLEVSALCSGQRRVMQPVGTTE